LIQLVCSQVATNFEFFITHDALSSQVTVSSKTAAKLSQLIEVRFLITYSIDALSLVLDLYSSSDGVLGELCLVFAPGRTARPVPACVTQQEQSASVNGSEIACRQL
jgi:hypothetical protein